MATGRSDYPNQVNNVLGFPFIFRGALDVRARAVSEKMKIAAARALADLAKEPVPDSVLRAYDLERLQFGPDYLIPKPFDPRVLLDRGSRGGQGRDGRGPGRRTDRGLRRVPGPAPDQVPGLAQPDQRDHHQGHGTAEEGGLSPRRRHPADPCRPPGRRRGNRQAGAARRCRPHRGAGGRVGAVPGWDGGHRPRQRGPPSATATPPTSKSYAGTAGSRS